MSRFLRPVLFMSTGVGKVSGEDPYAVRDFRPAAVVEEVVPVIALPVLDVNPEEDPDPKAPASPATGSVLGSGNETSETSTPDKLPPNPVLRLLDLSVPSEDPADAAKEKSQHPSSPTLGKMTPPAKA